MGTSDPALLTALMLARELSADTIKPDKSANDSSEHQEGPLNRAGLSHTI